MKRTSYLFLLLLIALLLLPSCKPAKQVLSSHISEALLSDPIFFGSPELVVRVTVKNIADEYFTNPDGEDRTNAHITLYNLEVSETLKGTLRNNELQIKIFNGEGMSKELYLYGEDDRYILEEKEEPFSLEPGKEYILGLVSLDPTKFNCYGDPGGYVIFCGKTWTFIEGEDGSYENLDPGVNHKKIALSELKEKLEEHEE